MSSHRSPAEVRSSVKHPIIDADGHWIEYNPVFAERMRKVAGDKAADGFIASQRRIPDALKLSIDERKQRGIAMEGYWSRQSTNTRDRATAMMPRMLYDRLDELGIDFGVIYPTAGLGIPRIADDETRRAVIRGFNIVTAEYFAKLSDRLTPAAVIPMWTPEEAIEELEFCTKQLGTKVGMFGGGFARRIPVGKDLDPTLGRFAVTYENLGIDSAYDYDAVWQKCRELQMAPTFHAGGRGFGLRNSPSNFTFNHIGHFAAAGHSIAKGLFLGGVTRRFPDMNFAFLEGGVGWGCQLFADLIEHWERRGAKGIAYMDPKKLDRKLLKSLVDKYGYDEMAAELDKRDGWPSAEEDNLTGGMPVLDDFAACQDRAQGGLGRSLCPALLFRLRGRRPHERDGVRQGQPVRRAHQRDLQLRHRPFRRAGHAEPGAGSARAGRGRADHARRLPRLHLHQRRAPVGPAEPALLRGHGGGQGSGRRAEHLAGARRRRLAEGHRWTTRKRRD